MLGEIRLKLDRWLKRYPETKPASLHLKVDGLEY